MAKGKKFVTVVFNAKTRSVRNDKMAGRDYLVVPMVMLTEGVHRGSAGSYLYQASEIAKRPQLWNKKPVLVNHPDEPSACTPEILNVRQIGDIMNTKWDGKKNRLTAEAWLDEEMLKRVDKGGTIQSAIENGDTLELSTGLFADSDEEEGEWNGESYEGTLKNFGPDHLAVLPDDVGACSIEDGAGFYRNVDGKLRAIFMEGRELLGVVVIENKVVEKDGKWYVYSHDGKKKLGGPYDTEKEANKRLGEIEYFKKKAAKNELSQNAVRDQLQKLVSENKSEEVYYWVEDVYDSYFIWSTDKGLFQREYEVDGDVVKLKGLDVSVIRKLTYDPIKNEKNIKNQENVSMDKKAIVDKLIANKVWAETDRDMLMALDEKVLSKMVPVQNIETPKPPKEEPKAPQNAEPKQKTLDEYLADMPAEIRGTVQNAMRAEQQEKDRLINIITKNPKNTFKPEYLKTQDMEMLQNLAKLAGEETKPENTRFNYGMGDPHVTNIGNDDDMKDVPLLGVPVLNIGPKEKQKAA